MLVGLKAAKLHMKYLKESAHSQGLELSSQSLSDSPEKLLLDLNENFMVKEELSMIAGKLSLSYENIWQLLSLLSSLLKI